MTKPFGPSLADEGAGERGEGEAEVGASPVADGEPAAAGQPC